MSKNKHHRASVVAGLNAQTTGPTQQPTQEKTMEAAPQDTVAQAETPPLSTMEQTGPTAKQMAAAEEANQLRLKKIAEGQQEETPRSVSLSEAAKGYDALHDAMREHAAKTAANRKVYTPPPRTPNQMSRLQEELEAGAKRVAAAEAQKAASRPIRPDGNKEGFTTPVYRPNDVVPDPISGGMKGFSPDV
jgi:hypothetical protein